MTLTKNFELAFTDINITASLITNEDLLKAKNILSQVEECYKALKEEMLSC